VLMKGIKRTGGFLCFLGCTAAMAGILATAAPMIDYDPLQAFVRSLSTTENGGLIKILYSVLSFCLAENYLVFAGGIALLFIGGVIRTMADRALFEVPADEPEVAAIRHPSVDSNPSDARDASLSAQEPASSVNVSPATEDFRPQIIVNPLKASQPEEYKHCADPIERNETSSQNSDTEIVMPLPGLSVQTEEPSLSQSDNPVEEESTPQRTPYSKYPDWAYEAPVAQAAPKVSDQPEDHAERPMTDASEWETRETTDERVIIARRENSAPEVKIPPEVTKFFEPTQFYQVPAPAEPTPLEQSAKNCREHNTEEAVPMLPNTGNPFQYKVFRAEGRPVVVTTLRNAQFQYDRIADPLPTLQSGTYEENDTRIPLQQLKSGVQIVNTLGRRIQR